MIQHTFFDMKIINVLGRGKTCSNQLLFGILKMKGWTYVAALKCWKVLEKHVLFQGFEIGFEQQILGVKISTLFMCM